MKKYFLMSVALLLGAASFTSCSDDDDNNTSEAAYSDKSYGQNAIDACSRVSNSLTAANEKVGSAKLTDEQTAELKQVLSNLVDNVIVPTYTQLANDAEALQNTLKGFTVNTLTQTAVNNACTQFKAARQHWERSEAFLMGAAKEFDIDPTIDSWPLNRSLLLTYLRSGRTDFSSEELEDATILGFHALEFFLFRNGQPRNVEEFKNNDTYKNFTNISGATELAYAQRICELLVQRCYQLQVAWEGQTSANASRYAVVQKAGLDVVNAKGLTFGTNLKNAGTSNSTFPTIADAITQVLSADEGSCVGIANEVGTAKIANPFSAGYVFYVESPFSYNSITDFQDNIRSIRNVWYGTLDGNTASHSFSQFFANNATAQGRTVETNVNDAINLIGKMPAPFVKYVSTIWNIAYEDDSRTSVPE